jgi:Leucine-rich repeat (LRR) protein
MKYIKSYKDFTINEAFSKSIKDKLTIKFKAEKPDLTDEQIIYYIDEFDKMKSSPKVIEKDILKYSFIELEKLIDSFPKKVNKSETGLDNLSQDDDDVIYNENNLLILTGDSREKCIKYGKGYKWCISRQDSSNMFNTYRFRYDEINFYFIFDKDRTDDNRALVLLIDKNGKYYLANASNSGDFTGNKEYSYEQICGFQPKLKELKSLFKPLPLTQKEKEIHAKIKNVLKEDNLLDFFGSYEILEAYISFGHVLTDNQYTNLTDELKSKYINLGHELTDKQKLATNKKLLGRYYEKCISLGRKLTDNEYTNLPDNLKEMYYNSYSLEKWLDSKYSKEEQAELTNLDCSNRKISNLEGIEKLIKLKSLDCSKNKLTSLKGIENLTNIYLLNCGENHLTSLKGIEKLIKLERLFCNKVGLISLKEIENLTNIYELKCNNNKLTSLKGIENLKRLSNFECNNNKLTSLKGIEKLKNIGSLDCSYNKLTSLKEIEKLYELYVLKCNNNDVEFNSKEILKKIINGGSGMIGMLKKLLNK